MNRGFFTFETVKQDGYFTGNIFFKKKMFESWDTALKREITKKEKEDDRIRHPIIITYFTKL